MNALGEHDFVIPDRIASDTIHKIPKVESTPETGAARLHVTCDHKEDQLCDIVRDELKSKFAQYEPEFEKMPIGLRIRPDERTLIKLKHVTPEMLKAIVKETSEVNCVQKVRIILKN